MKYVFHCRTASGEETVFRGDLNAIAERIVSIQIRNELSEIGASQMFMSKEQLDTWTSKMRDDLRKGIEKASKKSRRWAIKIKF